MLADPTRKWAEPSPNWGEPAPISAEAVKHGPKPRRGRPKLRPGPAPSRAEPAQGSVESCLLGRGALRRRGAHKSEVGAVRRSAWPMFAVLAAIWGAKGQTDLQMFLVAVGDFPGGPEAHPQALEPGRMSVKCSRNRPHKHFGTKTYSASLGLGAHILPRGVATAMPTAGVRHRMLLRNDWPRYRLLRQ